MAYKFQMGPARLSGNTVFEEQIEVSGGVALSGVPDTAVTVADDSILFYDGDGNMKRESFVDYATALAATAAGLQASSGQIGINSGNGLKIDSNALVVEPDDFAGTGLEDDGSDNLRIAAAAAGLGISGGGGSALALDFSELADEQIASGDRFAFRDATDDGMHADTVDDLATLFAGSGLGAASAVLSVQVSGAVVVASDKVGLSASIAGTGLTYQGGTDSIEAIHLDLNELGSATVDVSADSFAFTDSDDGNKGKQDTIADLMTAVAGDALVASSGVLAVGVDDSSIEIDSDALRIKAAGVTDAMMNDDVATGLAGVGLSAASGVMALDLNELTAEAVASGDFLAFVDSTDNGTHKETVDDLATLFAGNGLSASSAVMALDLNELSAAAVDVANDSIAIVDANDSNGSKKESIADLVTAMAGAGLTATSGVLKVTGNNVASRADGDTLAEGYNYFADLSADATVTLPASPSIGDVVTVKAKGLTGASIIIQKAGTQAIDGESTATIESPYGALSMVYVASNDWRIV